MKIKVWLIAATVIGVLIPWIAPAADAERFREGGVVVSYDRESGTLVVDDSGYRLSPTLRIHSTSGQQLSVDALRPGTKIRFNIVLTEGSRKLVISEILVVPVR